ncbi:rhodanese-related sulfurtransferase [Volucribacter psittacicida]|uniref:Rhodanese-related sulfurtransferase n=1 Tax=Volucribacter psittacicida TaxID=203482 RepID=A0A4R1FUZ9_9PAST|nr:rhodanese-like domain-containing protein [Volucribacter psittacicida]TCJ98663.1 rhodanese-related sulfurtransferase [Volucribacter psittacicida]
MENLDFVTMAIEFAKNHTLMVVAWFTVFFMVIYTFLNAATAKFKMVSNTEMTMLINKDNAKVVDLRTIDEFKRGHIIHSLQLTPSDIKKQNIGKIEQHKDVPVVLVDTSGFTATASAKELVKQGFRRVYVLKEGITGWRSANLPLEK